MADVPTQPQIETWQDKLEAGNPLNLLEEVKADADYNYRHRLREIQERDRFQQAKNGDRASIEETDNVKDTKGNK